MKSLSLAFFLSAVTLTAGESQAAPLEGSIGLRAQGFLIEPLFDEQLDRRVDLQLQGLLKGRYLLLNSAESELEFRFEIRGSLDEVNVLGDVKNAAIQYTRSRFSLRAGFLQESWGLMSVHSPLDTFNQTDEVADFRGLVRLGQPGIALEYLGIVDLTLLVSNTFTDRRLNDDERRFRFSELPFATPVLEPVDEIEENNLAFRLGTQAGDFSLSLIYFYGLGRDPVFVPVFDDGVVSVPIALAPTYRLEQQAGLTIERPVADYVLRAEAYLRVPNDDMFSRYGGWAIGVDRSFWDIGKNAAGDILGTIEYYRSDRSNDAPVTIFDNDLAVGMRWAFNDPKSKEVSFLLIHDLDVGSTSFDLGYKFDISDSLVFEANAQYFVNVDDDPALQSFANDNNTSIAVSWIF